MVKRRIYPQRIEPGQAFRTPCFESRVRAPCPRGTEDFRASG